MRAIYKYPFPIEGCFCLRLPVGARVLAAQVQGETPCLWAEVDPERAWTHRHFRLFGTGHPMPEGGIDDLRYVSTFQMPPFVWHLYEVV